MTWAQHTESAHRSQSFVRSLLRQDEHDANDQTANMSSHGPIEGPSLIPPPREPSTQYLLAESTEHAPDSNTSDSHAQGELPHACMCRPSCVSQATQTGEIDLPNVSCSLTGRNDDSQPCSSKMTQTDCILPVLHNKETQTTDERVSKQQLSGSTNRVRFDEFAEQVRLQKYHEKRKQSLESRKKTLQKIITLSARLHRSSLWIRDGLVEISKYEDATGFVRVHQHMQNLVDLCHSQWKHELHTLDPLESSELMVSSSTSKVTNFFSRLSNIAQADLLELISCLRSNPRFLVERFKALSPSQIVSLSTAPRFEPAPEPLLSSLTPNGSRVSQKKRVQSYSKSLEEYASSFERSNPFSFLLFNVYSTDHSLATPENRLRLSTWSTICADLMLCSEDAYRGLLPQILSAFASVSEWRARDAVELFLMETIQKGAFLLDQKGNSSRIRTLQGYKVLYTEPAQEFFSRAVCDLFYILVECGGGYPVGVLQFSSAVLGKLPHLDQQSRFRGEVLNWFVNHFLRLVITYPENENMLLRFHVSQSARDSILLPLCQIASEWVPDALSHNPLRPVDPQFQGCVLHMVNELEAIESVQPYEKHETIDGPVDVLTASAITICASEVVQVLEALSPQTIHNSGLYDPFQLGSGFHNIYSRASDRFDRLRREILFMLEPGSSSRDSHPCQEDWLSLQLDDRGNPKIVQDRIDDSQSGSTDDDDSLDTTQIAALRICDDHASGYATGSTTGYQTEGFQSSLTTLFQQMVRLTSASGDVISSCYWEDALDTLHDDYPLSNLIQDDTPVLSKLLQRAKDAQTSALVQCARLHTQIGLLEDVASRIRAAIVKFVDRFEDLRLKLWYCVDVTSCKSYDDARNVVSALNNMAISTVLPPTSFSRPVSRSSRRPLSSHSSTSSMFGRPLEDTMSILKAPNEHGGPKKLADAQVDMINAWLQRCNLDNFCKGEERIHRFCMEVHLVSQRLTGGSLSESPVLWSSELFVRERTLYDVHVYGVTSAPASTRPASVMSETLSTGYRPSRSALQNMDSARLFSSEDHRSPARRTSLHNLSATRLCREVLHSDLASSIGSPGRAYSATTAESIVSNLWSPLPSNSRSMTSASIYSRPPSTFNDQSLSRFTDHAREKSTFLEKTKRALVCLLLSDLGSSLWSCGSETDSWLKEVQSTRSINARIKQRIRTENLMATQQQQPAKVPNKNGGSSITRSLSMSSSTPKDARQSSSEQLESMTDEAPSDDVLNYIRGLGEILTRLSQQIDPVEKLAAIEDFYKFSVGPMLSKARTARPTAIPSSMSTAQRRSSLDSRIPNSQTKRDTTKPDKLRSPRNKPTEHEIVQHLKTNLMELQPKTLFRDLQYIAVFAPTEMTEKTSRGEALVHLGLAALAYKDEVCRSMVDVADRIMARAPAEPNFSSTTSENTIAKAGEYWMFAAREGNAVAQRELALLYLSHPEVLPITSLPLATVSKIFRNDVLWNAPRAGTRNGPALRLAYHWMQQSSNNGDVLATQKLEEGGGERISLR